MMTSAQSAVGRRVRRQDGDSFVTGRAVFTGDVTLPDITYAALVRSPYAHAHIVSVDIAAAEAHPGVLTVLTGAQAVEMTEEIPHGLDAGHLGGHHGVARPLAVGTVVYATEPLAAVVAENPADAAAAALLVDVTYEPLPTVLDSEAALEPDAPLLYPRLGHEPADRGAHRPG
jgi:aerobic carbon-monoxide dehydrogenase large subunit